MVKIIRMSFVLLSVLLVAVVYVGCNAKDTQPETPDVPGAGTDTPEGEEQQTNVQIDDIDVPEDDPSPGDASSRR